MMKKNIFCKKARRCKITLKVIRSFILSLLLVIISCKPYLKNALEYAGNNNNEIECVLEHFENDPNPLKYRAACFIIENIPYHHTLYDDRAKKFEDAYITMATDAMEFHDSVIDRETKKLGGALLSSRSEVLTIKSDYLIKASYRILKIYLVNKI